MLSLFDERFSTGMLHNARITVTLYSSNLLNKSKHALCFVNFVSFTADTTESIVDDHLVHHNLARRLTDQREHDFLNKRILLSVETLRVSDSACKY